MLVGVNALAIVGGPTTVTVLLQELFTSLVSGTVLLGSTAQLPPEGLAYVPAALAVAVKLTSKEPGAAMVTAPLAMQVRTLLAMPQLIVPVMPLGLETPADPYVGPPGRVSVRMIWVLVKLAGAEPPLATWIVQVQLAPTRGRFRRRCSSSSPSGPGTSR